MAQQFLNGAEVRAIGEKMCGECVTQRMRVQVPIDIHETDVFFDDTADGTLGQAAAGEIQKNGFGVRRSVAAGTS